MTCAVFFDALRADPRFRPERPEALLEGYGALRDRVNVALPGAVRRAPARRVRDPGGRALSRAGGGRGVVRAGQRRRQASRHLLRQHLRSAVPADVPDGGDLSARGGARASLPDVDRPGDRAPAAVPAFRTRHGLCRGLGRLRRNAGHGARALRRPLQPFRRVDAAGVACRAARRRYRAPRAGLVAAACDRLPARKHVAR